MSQWAEDFLTSDTPPPPSRRSSNAQEGCAQRLRRHVGARLLSARKECSCELRVQRQGISRPVTSLCYSLFRRLIGLSREGRHHRLPTDSRTCRRNLLSHFIFR